MAIVISGVNNNDKITASDGTIDLLSGVNYSGIITSPGFTTPGNLTAGHINIGSGIQLGNAGVATATTFVGNLTGNVNATSNLLLQISGSEKFRVGSSGQLGVGGANYGTSGQVLTSGGSGSAATWSTINSDKIAEGNTEAEVVDTGSDGHFKVTTEGSERLRINSSGQAMIGTTTPTSNQAAQALTIALQNSGNTGITLRSGTGGGDLNEGSIFFSDATSGAGEYAGYLQYSHANEYFRIGVNSTERVRIDAGGNMNVTGIVTATAFVPTTGQLSHRNIIINGDCRIAQRGGSSTSAGYHTVDRFRSAFSGNDEGPTQSQFAVSAPGAYHLPTSGPHPYKEGFRQAFGLTNGNQTSGAGTSDSSEFIYALEAKDLLYSGWDYTNPNSYITLSFWVKSSAAQNFYFFLKTSDGTNKMYPMETGNLTAFTWKKITKTIPGHSDLSFDDNTNEGMRIDFPCYYGTDLTNNSTSLDAWANYNGAARTPDHATTWYTTNDASFQITGLQLEVGPVATPFEHLSYADNLSRCQRYYECVKGPSAAPTSNSETLIGIAQAYTTSRALMNFMFKQEKRTYPAVEASTASDIQVLVPGVGWVSAGSVTGNTNRFCTRVDIQSLSGSPMTVGHAVEVRILNASILGFDAEL